MNIIFSKVLNEIKEYAYIYRNCNRKCQVRPFPSKTPTHSNQGCLECNSYLPYWWPSIWLMEYFDDSDKFFTSENEKKNLHEWMKKTDSCIKNGFCSKNCKYSYLDKIDCDEIDLERRGCFHCGRNIGGLSIFDFDNFNYDNHFYCSLECYDNECHLDHYGY